MPPFAELQKIAGGLEEGHRWGLWGTGLGFAGLGAANTATGQLSATEIVATKVMTGFVVFGMLAALHFLTAASSRLQVRLIFLIFLDLYSFFVVWPVGLGHGFYWKELAGQEFTCWQFADKLDTASDAMNRTALSLATAEQAAQGAADQPASAVGDGPLTRSRAAFADRTEAAARDVQTAWIAPLLVRRGSIARQISALQGRTDLAARDAAASGQLRRLVRTAELAGSERRMLYPSAYEDIRALTRKAYGLRALHAPAISGHLFLAWEVGRNWTSPALPIASVSRTPTFAGMPH